MSQFPFSVSPLGKQDRTSFDCGVEPLNDYFHVRVSQDVRRKVTSCFVLTENATGNIAGYYTLSACHVHLKNLEPDWQKKLPRYPHVPAVRLGRLAVDLNYRKQKLGSAMLMNAVARTARNEISMYMMMVDAKDDEAARFYLHHGFRFDRDNNSVLIAPISTIAKGLSPDA